MVFIFTAMMSFILQYTATAKCHCLSKPNLGFIAHANKHFNYLFIIHSNKDFYFDKNNTNHLIHRHHKIDRS